MRHCGRLMLAILFLIHTLEIPAIGNNRSTVFPDRPWELIHSAISNPFAEEAFEPADCWMVQSLDRAAAVFAHHSRALRTFQPKSFFRTLVNGAEENIPVWIARHLFGHYARADVQAGRGYIPFMLKY